MEEEKRRAKEREKKEIQEKIRKLTEENESLKRNNNAFIQTFERMVAFQDELKQKVKYYRDKYYSASKLIEATRKEVRLTEHLERETFAQREVDTSLNCSVGEENRRIEGSTKEKFESMHEQYKIIRKFKTRGATQYNRRKV